ncbi:MAG: energy-coupling factor transporter transmembrane component T, partial [Sphaerobacter sp.]|nr:energy-coupling factor transporter transmembrane component T [Sphaerobacter sp.]
TGDHVLARLPRSLPIIGGPLTLNALVYGLVSALALLDLLLLAATFSAAVERAALLRLVPGSLAAVGVAAVVGLSVFPQTLRAVRDVQEAQAARGFRVRSIRDVPPLLVPVLQLGLEHAFDLAEAMESRAFGHGRPARIPPFLAVGAVLGAAAAALALGLGQPVAAAGCLLPLLGLLVAMHRGGGRGRYRPVTWTWPDGVALASAAVAALIIVASLGSTALSYAPYPRLTWPPFALAPGLAALLLAVPALLPGGRGTP